jgi:hypothetical protein
MRDIFSRTVKDNRVTLLDGVFQSTGMEDGWADLVVVAQVLDAAYSSLILNLVDIRPFIGVLIMMQLQPNSRAFSTRKEW